MLGSLTLFEKLPQFIGGDLDKRGSISETILADDLNVILTDMTLVEKQCAAYRR